jgi:hypothetical protein
VPAPRSLASASPECSARSIGAACSWSAGTVAFEVCRCSGLGVAQLGSEPWCGTVDAILLIDEIDRPRGKGSLTWVLR